MEKVILENGPLAWQRAVDERDLPRLLLLLRGEIERESDVNFAFQQACDEGWKDGARAMLSKTGIISVSRGLRNALGSKKEGSAGCAQIAQTRLIRENKIDQFDLAQGLLALREKSPGGEKKMMLALELAEDGAVAWALTELLRTARWEPAARLLERSGVVGDESELARAIRFLGL